MELENNEYVSSSWSVSISKRRNSDFSDDETTMKRFNTKCDEKQEETKKQSRPEAAKFPKLFRLLREGEDITKGLTAKNPNGNEKVAVHVATGSKRYCASQYISKCGSLIYAESLRGLKLRSSFRWGMKDIVEIDVGTLPDDVTIIDLRTQMERRKYETSDQSINYLFHRYAETHQEVLLIGTVPSSCLTLHNYRETYIHSYLDSHIYRNVAVSQPCLSVHEVTSRVPEANSNSHPDSEETFRGSDWQIPRTVFRLFVRIWRGMLGLRSLFFRPE